MHNEHIFPANEVDDFTVPTPGRLRLLDQVVSEGLNATDGGDYAPSAPIGVGGEGVVLDGPTCLITGSVETGKGAGGLVLPASVYPTFATPRTKSVLVHLCNEKEFASPEVASVFIPNDDPQGIKCVSTDVIDEAFFYIPARLIHHGATLDRIRLCYRYGKKPTTTQLTTPSQHILEMRLFRIPSGAGFSYGPPNLVDLFIYPTFQATTFYNVGDVIIPTVANSCKYVCTVAGTTGASSAGWSTTACAIQVSGSASFRVEGGAVFLNLQQHYVSKHNDTTLAATATALFADGTPQFLDILPNVNAVIDTKNYSYVLHVFTPPCDVLFHSITLDLSGIVDMAPP